MKTIQPVTLIACASQKLDRRARAADLYQSDWFRKARTYVELSGGTWFILSAKHGLLKPSTRIEPYDASLATIGARGRAAWRARVVAQLDRAIGRRFAGPIVFLAGRHYRDPLMTYAGDRAYVPMAGLGIGQQKAWLAGRIAFMRERDARALQLDLFDDRP